MRDSVAQACRAALSGDENARKCHPSVPYFTLGRRKVWVSLPKSPIHPYVILPYTHGQQKCTEVLPKRAALHPRATESVGFVAEESHSSLRHSVLYLWASIMDRSVTQACRILLLGDEKYGFRCPRVPFILTSFCLAPFGNENGLKCRLKVSYCTLGRRKCATVLPKRVVLHSRATERLGSVAQACRAALSGDDIGLKCCLRWGVGSHRSTSPLVRAVELHRGFYLMWLYWLYHVEGGEEAAVGGGFLFQG